MVQIPLILNVLLSDIQILCVFQSRICTLAPMLCIPVTGTGEFIIALAMKREENYICIK